MFVLKIYRKPYGDLSCNRTFQIMETNIVNDKTKGVWLKCKVIRSIYRDPLYDTASQSAL